MHFFLELVECGDIGTRGAEVTVSSKYFTNHSTVLRIYKYCKHCLMQLLVARYQCMYVYTHLRV